MLNIAKQGTYTDGSGYEWVFYQDDTTPSFFYIVPRPQWAYDGAGKLVFQVVKYLTNDASNGSGYCHIGVELAVPQSVQSAITSAVAAQFGVSNPTFQALQYNQGGAAYLNFTFEGTTTVYTVSASSFGNNTATFVLQLTAAQLDSLVAAFSTSGGAYVVQYNLTVPARLPAVTAVLTFNSSAAYEYQVQQPQHHTWGKDTPGSTTALLTDSQSSNVTITWGEANPPASLESAVADWANTTLATLVNAEITQELALQGLTSSDSFDINEVSSFTETYQQNTVVDWTITPQAALSSLADLGQNIDNFIATVNEQQQVMAVSTNVPFQSDGSSNASFSEMLVQSVTVTASYPGLAEASATATLTSNGTVTFTAPYNSSAGPSWSLTYTVTYQSGGTQISGTVNDIDQATYTLSMTEIGILTVTFDASQAFPSGSGLERVDLVLTFVDFNGRGETVASSMSISATDSTKRANLTTMVGVPLTTPYNYTVTYVYQNGVTYTPPTANGQTGFSQTIYAPSAIHSTTIMIVLSNTDPNQILEAIVNVWYPQPPSIPGIGNQPTESSPSVFTLIPSPSGSYSFATDVFSGYMNAGEPLMYSASINALTGQIDINDQLIEGDQASVMITTTQEYFTLQIDPSAIDWSSAAYQSVQVQVTVQVSGSTMTPRAFIWNSGETSPKYLTVPIQTGQLVSYTWQATYIEPDASTQPTASGTSSNVILVIPATA